MVPAGTLEALLGVGVVTRGIGPLGHEGFFKAMAFPAPAQSGACLLAPELSPVGGEGSDS